MSDPATALELIQKALSSPPAESTTIAAQEQAWRQCRALQFPYCVAKRVVDLAIASIALVALAPAMALVALIIRLDSNGPAIYASRRVGKDGRPFDCYKFRSMVVDADAMKTTLQHLNYREGATFKVLNDPRTTRVGRFLRKFSIDEVPQLWNVIINDMSIVGPRPHPLDDVARYPEEAARRLEVKPGMTGLWQIKARQDPSFEKNLFYDVQYIDNWTFWLDVKIVAATFSAVLRGSGE